MNHVLLNIFHSHNHHCVAFNTGKEKELISLLMTNAITRTQKK